MCLAVFYWGLKSKIQIKFSIRHSDLVIDLTFVICHSGFPTGGGMWYPLIIILALTVIFIIFLRRSFEIGKKELPKILHEAELSEADRAENIKANEFLARAEKLFLDGKYLASEKWYVEAAHLEPQNGKIYARLGTVYLALKNYKDAQSALETCLKLEKPTAPRCYNLALANKLQGKNKEALQSAKEALSLDKSNLKYRDLVDELKKA